MKHAPTVCYSPDQDGYEIVSVESTIPPEPMSGSGWHCYVIGQGTNTIRGYRQGSLEAVKQWAEDTVTRLNERRFGKRGRVNLNMTKHERKAGVSRSAPGKNA